MNEERKWQSKLALQVYKLNDLLTEAADDGVFPAVRVHRNDKLYGFGVQVVEVSFVLGIENSTTVEYEQPTKKYSCPYFGERKKRKKSLQGSN